MSQHTHHNPPVRRPGTRFGVSAALAALLAAGTAASAQPAFTPNAIPSGDSQKNAIFATDFDADGDTDLVVGSSDGLSWFESDGSSSPSFVEHQISQVETESVHVADLDQDGDLDIAAGSRVDDYGFGWYENDGESVPAFTWHRNDFGSNELDGYFMSTSALFSGDINADGRLDIIRKSTHQYLSDPTYTGYNTFVHMNREQINGGLTSGLLLRDLNASQIRDTVPYALADFDGDGDVDLACGRTTNTWDSAQEMWVYTWETVWLQNDGDETPRFDVIPFPSSSTNQASSGFGADADGDGDTDLFLTYPDERMLRWFENDGAGNFVTEHTIPFDSSVQSVFATDLDADGDTDLVTVSGPDDNGEVWWHQNLGGDAMTFGSQPLLLNGTNGNSPFAADMNRDGNIDILSTDGDQLNWFAGGGDARVRNVTRGTEYQTIESALAFAADYNKIIAPAALFGAETVIDFRDTPAMLTSAASIRQFAGSRCVLTDGARLESSMPEYYMLGGARIPSSTSTDRIDMAGELRVDTDATADITTRTLAMDPGSLLNVRDIARLFVAADASLDGTTRVDRGAMLSIDGDTTGTGTLRVLDHGVVIMAGSFEFYGDALVTNANLESFGPMSLDSTAVFHNATIAASDLTIASPTSSLIVSGSLFAPVMNYGSVTCVGDTLAVGDYENIGTTTVQIGTLQVIGSLTNMGTLVGDMQSTRDVADSTQPGDGFAITGSYTVGPDASLVFPDPVWRLSVGGDLDVAIADHSSVDLREAELRLDGSGDQSIEVMSTDIGPDESGLDRTNPGHYPIGTLRVASGSTVVLVDSRDNDGAGQAAPEAIYAESLVVDAGATLYTSGLKVYYQSLTLAGSVDDASNLVAISGARSQADVNGDGLIDFGDINGFIELFLGNNPAADMNGDGLIDFGDISTFLAMYGAGC